MKKSKILFCTPYLYGTNIAFGGIGVWGKTILDYYHTIDEHTVELIPVSFDRKRKIGEVNDYGIKRFYEGFTEMSLKCREVKKIMDVQKPDVIHLCTSASLSLLKDFVLLGLAKKRKIRTVLHLHFGRVPKLKIQNNWEWKFLLLVLRKVDTIIAMDKKTISVLRQEGFDNVVYVPNPLSLSIINNVKELSSSVRRIPKQLLFIGHALKTKGVYELVEGCCEVKNVKLRLVGKISQEMKKELQMIAQKRDHAEWLSFVGEISHVDVLKELLAADVFVFPSYTEGFPNVILEAMACGCPIAASDVGAIPEMLNIREDACGICYEARNATKVREAISTLLGNSFLRRNYANKAIKRVNDMYAVPRVWQQLVNIWQLG